jgi:hypothetical protein
MDNWETVFSMRSARKLRDATIQELLEAVFFLYALLNGSENCSLVVRPNNVSEKRPAFFFTVTHRQTIIFIFNTKNVKSIAHVSRCCL